MVPVGADESSTFSNLRPESVRDSRVPGPLGVTAPQRQTTLYLGVQNTRENRMSGYHLFQCSILASGPRKAGLKPVPFA